MIQLYQNLWQQKLIKVNDLSSGHYSARNNIRFKTSILRSNLCDDSDAYVVNIRSVRDTNDANKRKKKVTCKNNGLFRSCISKISNTYIDNVEDLDIVLPMFNLLEYSRTYSITSGCLWDYYGDEVNDSAIENNDDGKKINNSKAITSNPFEFKTRKIGSMPNNNMLDAEVVVPLKYLSNF